MIFRQLNVQKSTSHLSFVLIPLESDPHISVTTSMCFCPTCALSLLLLSFVFWVYSLYCLLQIFMKFFAPPFICFNWILDNCEEVLFQMDPCWKDSSFVVYIVGVYFLHVYCEYITWFTRGSFGTWHYIVDCNAVSGFHGSISFLFVSDSTAKSILNFIYLNFFDCISSHVPISESAFAFVCLRFYFNQKFTSAGILLHRLFLWMN